MELPPTLVVDANVLFSFFQADSGRRRMIKRLNETGCRLISPDYVLEELAGRRERIRRFARINDAEFAFLFSLLERTVTTVDEARYQHESDEAMALAPHEKDIPYFALAHHAGAPIWSDETAFRDQDGITIYTTHDLFERLE